MPTGDFDAANETKTEGVSDGVEDGGAEIESVAETDGVTDGVGVIKGVEEIPNAITPFSSGGVITPSPAASFMALIWSFVIVEA